MTVERTRVAVHEEMFESGTWRSPQSSRSGGRLDDQAQPYMQGGCKRDLPRSVDRSAFG